VRGPATGTRWDQEACLLEFPGFAHGDFKRSDGVHLRRRENVLGVNATPIRSCDVTV
jgi:hypothetical protein